MSEVVIAFIKDGKEIGRIRSEPVSLKKSNGNGKNGRRFTVEEVERVAEALRVHPMTARKYLYEGAPQQRIINKKTDTATKIRNKTYISFRGRLMQVYIEAEGPLPKDLRELSTEKMKRWLLAKGRGRKVTRLERQMEI
jgi:hypothetical protein